MAEGFSGPSWGAGATPTWRSWPGAARAEGGPPAPDKNTIEDARHFATTNTGFFPMEWKERVATMLRTGTPMAPWTSQLSEAELVAVSHYVRTFYAGDVGAPVR